MRGAPLKLQQTVLAEGTFLLDSFALDAFAFHVVDLDVLRAGIFRA